MNRVSIPVSMRSVYIVEPPCGHDQAHLPGQMHAGSVRCPNVSVLYTEPQATAAAVRHADILARDLVKTIHVVALLCIPIQLAIDESPVPIEFLRKTTCQIVADAGSPSFEWIIHIHRCRTRLNALRRILPAHSLLIVGGKKCLWPGALERTCRRLEREGHVIIRVGMGGLQPEMRDLLAHEFYEN